MDNTSLPVVSGNLTAVHLESQVSPQQQHTQTLAPTPPDSCDDSDKSDDTTSTPILTPAEIKIKRKIDSAIAALKGAKKDLERSGKPGMLDRLGYREIEDLSKGMRQREAAQEEQQLQGEDSSDASRHRTVPVPETTMVDSLASVLDMLHTMSAHIPLATSSSHDPALSIDTEGPLSLLQIMVIKAHRVFLVDIPALGSAAFSTTLPTLQGPLSLERLLSAPNVLKLLWDCRGDGAMLKALQGISLDCVYDVQLMDLATRTTPGERKATKALSHAGPQRLHRELDAQTHSSWTTHKLFGKLTFVRGYPNVQRVYDDTRGDYSAAVKLLEARGQDLQLEAVLRADGTPTGRVVEIKQEHGDPFLIRPIPEYLRVYAVDDVRFLPAMFEHFVEHRFWNDEWAERVWRESGRRLGEGDVGWKVNYAPVGWDKVKQVDRTAVV
jgi:hypothetical protein